MPGSQQLLQDKLRIPRLSVTVLRRGRLTELIEQAAAHRVTLVSGPAGVGKTVACASWAAGPSGSRRAGWLTWTRSTASRAGSGATFRPR